MGGCRARYGVPLWGMVPVGEALRPEHSGPCKVVAVPVVVPHVALLVCPKSYSFVGVVDVVGISRRREKDAGPGRQRQSG